MSTKAIREALAQLNRLMPDSTYVGPAFDKVEAIERAAKLFVEANRHQTLATPEDFDQLMESIAKEAP